MDLRYPVGPMVLETNPSPERREAWRAELSQVPARLREAVLGLSTDALDTPYRPQGWTVRQVVHHMPDSHLNAYTRFKLALTEDIPTIRPYEEARWAELPDTAATPIEVSLVLLHALHQRWGFLLSLMSAEDYRRRFRHPAMDQEVTLATALGMYAWHGRHHVAHVTALRERMGW